MVNYSISAYGFGSYFAASPGPHDIDILLVHQSLSPASVELAVAAKRLLMRAQPLCHIVLLSEEEERTQEFIRRSGAIFLHTLHRDEVEADISDLVRTIGYAEREGFRENTCGNARADC